MSVKSILLLIMYISIAVWVFRTEGFDKDGNYKERGSDSEFSNPHEPRILLGRIGYALIVPFIIAAVIGYIFGID